MLPDHVLARPGERLDLGRDEDVQSGCLLDGVGVGLDLADVVALVPDLHPGDGEVVAHQAEPSVLSDDLGAGAEHEDRQSVSLVLTVNLHLSPDDPAVFLPYEGGAANIAHLAVEGDGCTEFHLAAPETSHL